MLLTNSHVDEEVSLLNRYQNIRLQTKKLCLPLYKEDYVPQPMVDVSPPKWHLGHTTWFFENFILSEYEPNFELFNPAFNYLFNSYYESQGPRISRSNRGNLSRPTVEEVYAYREYVNEQMSALLLKDVSKELLELIEVGLQHEQQHQELLVTDIKYILGNNPLFPVYSKQLTSLPSTPVSTDQFIIIPEGKRSIGHQDNNFCFDNELSVHEVYLPQFEIRTELVTNEEYLEFMNDGAYQKAELWLSEAWAWINENGIEAPEYWFSKDNSWLQFTMSGLKEVDLNQPVTHISYFEADAFARWKELRIPTEFEWEAACRYLSPQLSEKNNFLESNTLHPQTLNGLENNLLGNTWEWTCSAYLPYPNYPQYKGALGEYNGKFMINQMVLRGGSCASPISHIRPSYRNFFHADKRWQFTGIRLAK